MSAIVVGILQIIPALILLVYGWFKQKEYRVYFDMLLMIVPATLFYNMFIRVAVSTGVFSFYLYFLSKVILFVLPGLITIKLRKYKLSDFGITRKNLRSSLLLGFGFLIITALTDAVMFSVTLSINLFTFVTLSVPLFFDAFNEEFLFWEFFSCLPIKIPRIFYFHLSFQHYSLLCGIRSRL